MKRIFNTAGPCLPNKHYQLPSIERLPEVRELIDTEQFFLLYGPRQTGKSTFLRSVSRALTDEGAYAAITVSLESFVLDDVYRALPQIVRHLAARATEQLPDFLWPPPVNELTLDPETALREYLSLWAKGCQRKVVVFFDEVDALRTDILQSVLRQIRDGHASRPAPFLHSAALVAREDLGAAVPGDREPPEGGRTSIFNIKSRSLTLPLFSEDDVRTLLNQHTVETGQLFHSEAVHEIYYQTRGQPWLVNALAAQLATDFDALIKDREQTVMANDVLTARELLLNRRESHLDYLTSALLDARVRRILEPVIIGAAEFEKTFAFDFDYTASLGLVTMDRGRVEIACPFYREAIGRALTAHVQVAIPDDPERFVAIDGTIDMALVIDGFIGFWRENGERLLTKMLYREAAAHLVFMAYLQRVAGPQARLGRGFAVGTHRVDVVVKRGNRKDIVEIRLLGSPRSLDRGVEQVADFARQIGRDVAYLLLFDLESTVLWQNRGRIEHLDCAGINVVVIFV